MSFAVDSNIWIYGLDADSPSYRPARKFLERMLDADDVWVVTWSILYEVARVLSHPRVVARPLSSVEVEKTLLGFVRDAGIRVLPETDDHASFLHLVLGSCGGARGNFWHDCHIAATLLEHGVDTIYTRDTDFRKISLLKVIDPFAQSKPAR